ncbi:hypothetical protein FRC08_004849 [Ceratobasidium sp. 394]|nr:hypothetical protein FRC08_004849 [Ceratobasidium sp. 394]
MRNVMLPDNSRAVPVNIIADDPEDEPGEEMAREARVWRTYVKEADRWDRELVDGRNNVCIVKLAFSLFLVLCRFIVESIGDLKPDPTESTAQTLLIVSQTLVAIANGQPVSLPAQVESEGTPFSPSRSAVAVNVLWLLSLSLSVAVSLVAMLAKEWCYKFMSGRSGQIYDQARRRQERWNGIERWKLQELLAWLPGAMHLALLLFAAGLCVYLWDINTSVAAPVLVMTVLTTCVYTLATILPWIDKFCPYSTPATVLKAPLLVLLKPARSLIDRARFRSYWALSRWTTEDYPAWLQLALERMTSWLAPESTNHDPDRSTTEETKVPMDMVTAQMLAWLIENCEDQRSVDTALQAFSGADDGLPVVPLGDTLFYLAMSRLDTCVKPKPKSEALSAEELSQLSIALRYSRASIILTLDYLRRRVPDSRNKSYLAFDSAYPRGQKWQREVLSVHMSLLYLAHRQTTDSEKLAIVATSAVMLFYHPEGLVARRNALGEVFDSATSILAQHFEKGGTMLPASTIYQLVDSSAHYLVDNWSNWEDNNSHRLFLTLLARVVATYHETAPDTAYAAAITLVAVAFACDTYPTQETTSSDDIHEKRAVGVLRYYQSQRHAERDLRGLFLFGFFGIFPHCLQTSGIDTHLAAVIPFLEEKLRPNLEYSLIWSMSYEFSLEDHVLAGLFKSFSHVHTVDAELAVVLADLLIVGTRATASHSLVSRLLANPRTYAAAVISLCSVKSKEHQASFMRVISEHRIPDAPLTLLESYGNNELWHLCYALLDTRTPMFPVAAVHFGLLVASVIASTKDSLDNRRSALRPLLSFFADHEEPRPFVFQEFVSHLEQCITERSTVRSLRCTMQFIVDFCCDDWSPNMGTSAESNGGMDEVDWWRTLQELKNRYRPNIEDIGPGIEGIGYPPDEVPAGATTATSGAGSGASETQPDWYYPSDAEWCC